MITPSHPTFVGSSPEGRALYTKSPTESSVGVFYLYAFMPYGTPLQTV